MRNVLMVAFAIFTLFGMMPHKAHAVVPPFCPFCVPAGSGPVMLAGSSAAGLAEAAISAVGVVWVFPYLNTTGEKPFEKYFTDVDYSYPQTPAGYEHVVVENGVRVGYHAPVPHTAVYDYQDEKGVHHVH